MEFRIEEGRGATAAEAGVEIVERKGLGHPDTICDAVLEHISQALCRAYLDRFGRILHHNCDKGCLIAGRTEVRLGGGRVLEPMRLIIGDRATALGDGRVDVAAVAVESAKAWFRRNLTRIDPDVHLRCQVELKPGSAELTKLFDAGGGVLGANDTSAAVGYAPLTETEETVLDAERYLNSADFKKAFPETGEDVKVMAVRTGRRVGLTISMPLVDRAIDSEDRYFRCLEDVRDALLKRLRARLRNLDEVTADFNCLDRRGAGLSGMYLTVLGTSAESGDSGQVGRGNGVNGVTSLNRHQLSESAAGKNPVSHVGKIYSIFSHVMAGAIYGAVPGLREVTVWMCSRIGEPVDRPWVVAVRAHPQPGVTLSDVSGRIEREVGRQVARIPVFCRDLGQGTYPVC